jgi:[ribosomal protein S5]-alanine N-acetyltransferase
MEIELRPIELTLDRKKEMYSSENSQLLIRSYEEYYKEIGYIIPWIGYFVVRDNQIVGSCGFKGQPKDDKVEIAYWTFAEHEGQGIATFCCRELISISRKFDPTIEITATTSPEDNASTKILESNGFSFQGIVQDDEIGDAWLWSFKLNNQRAGLF